VQAAGQGRYKSVLIAVACLPLAPKIPPAARPADLASRCELLRVCSHDVTAERSLRAERVQWTRHLCMQMDSSPGRLG